MKKTKENSSGLFKAGIIFFIFSIITAIFNYLYHLFMGRMLGPSDYGILGSLFAIIYFVTFSISPFNLIISKNVAEHHLKSKEKIKYIYYKILKSALGIGFILLIIYSLLAPFIAEYMNLTNIYGIILVGIIAYFSFISVILTGTLNGMQKFLWQNISSFSATFIKFTLAIFLVFLGFKVNGALTSIIIGILLSIIIAYIPIKKELKNSKPQKYPLKEIYYYAITVFLASVFSILIITIDQILVKHFFDSSQAGIYIAASIIAKTIWFGSSFLISPLFPKVVSLKSQNKDPSKLLFYSLFYISIIVIIGCSILFLVPGLIVSLLYGNIYNNAIPLVGLFGISLGMFSLIQIFMTYNLAVEKYKFIYFFIIGILIETIGIYLFHNSLIQIVKILLLTSTFVIFCFIIYNKKELFNDKKYFRDIFKISKILNPADLD